MPNRNEALFAKYLIDHGYVLNHLLKPLKYYMCDSYDIVVYSFVEAKTINEYVNENADMVGGREKAFTHLCEELASTLACLHNNRFIHCDLNGNNILIDKLDRVLIIDYGTIKVNEKKFTAWSR